MPLFNRINLIAGRYHLSQSALPGSDYYNAAMIDTGGWPTEALVALAQFAAKRFTAEGYHYVACGAFNQFAA